MATSTSVLPAIADTVAADDPAERRMFQLTDLSDNHNKFYLVELWPVQGDGDTVRFRASWGRVGAKAQACEKVVSWREVERQIAEKVRKGYRPVDLHRPPIELIDEQATGNDAQKPVVRLDPRVAQLVDWVFREAGEHIESFLAVEVGALSQAQIAEGRRLLSQAQRYFADYRRNSTGGNMQMLAATVQSYYNAVPTKLPARVDREQVVLDFCKEFSEQEDRLLQLEAAIATMKAQRQHPGHNPYQTLGAELQALDPEDPTSKTITEYIERTQMHGYKMKVRDVFSVHIPDERQAYEHNRKGTSRHELLFHGTMTQNVRHILRQGLICPSTPSHGRMLGSGIYLANTASKSANYSASKRGNVPRMMFVVEAALGKCYMAPQAHNFPNPPLGYDSICGKAGYTRTFGVNTLMHDEFVLFSPAQQTIRYLVTFD